MKAILAELMGVYSLEWHAGALTSFRRSASWKPNCIDQGNMLQLDNMLVYYGRANKNHGQFDSSDWNCQFSVSFNFVLDTFAGFLV